LNTVEAVVAGKKIVFEKITRPTSLQQKALDLCLSFSNVYPVKAGIELGQSPSQHRVGHFVKSKVPLKISIKFRSSILSSIITSRSGKERLKD